MALGTLGLPRYHGCPVFYNRINFKASFDFPLSEHVVSTACKGRVFFTFRLALHWCLREIFNFSASFTLVISRNTGGIAAASSHCQRMASRSCIRTRWVYAILPSLSGVYDYEEIRLHGSAGIKEPSRSRYYLLLL